MTKTCTKCGHLYVPGLGGCPDCRREHFARGPIIELTPAMAGKARALELGLKLVSNNIEGKPRRTPSPYIRNVATALGKAILRKDKL